MTSIEGKDGPKVLTVVDTQAIIRKWETAVFAAERLFRNLENHRAKAGHLGFHMFRLDKAQDGTGLMIALCSECGEELDRARNIFPHEVVPLVYDVWNQMVREAKIELKARLKAGQKS